MTVTSRASRVADREALVEPHDVVFLPLVADDFHERDFGPHGVLYIWARPARKHQARIFDAGGVGQAHALDVGAEQGYAELTPALVLGASDLVVARG